MDVLMILTGLAFLFAGGEGLVKGSVVLAEKLNISTLLVSVVVVGFGTSSPELMVSVAAGLQNAPDIALGNIVGSNIANVLLILGLSAIIYPLACTRSEIKRDAWAVFFASALLSALSLYGHLNWLSGLIMLVILVVYICYSYFADTQRIRVQLAPCPQSESVIEKKPMSLGKASFLVLIGLVMLVCGAHFLINGATAIAETLGIPSAIIGLTLVALGTWLRELVEQGRAAYRKHADVVIGNILGSNLFNILGIVGLTAVLNPIPFAGRIAEIDVWIMLLVAIACLPIIRTGLKISRLEGVAFLSLYVIYTSWIYITGS